MSQRIRDKATHKEIVQDRPRTDFVIGIDPGLRGGWAVFDCRRQRFKHVALVPTITPSEGKKTYDAEQLELNLSDMVENQCSGCTFTFCIERQQAMPAQGVVSMFTTGYGFGLWNGLLVGLQAPFPKSHEFFIITAKTWQQLLIGEEAEDDTKCKSIARVQRLFPDVNLIPPPKGRKPSDGMADACNIAHYAFLRMVDSK